MKRVLFSLAILCVAFTLSAQNQQDTLPISLTKETFIQRVWNYPQHIQGNNVTWNYIGDKPCLIDFWAAWCGPCRMLTPHLEEMAKKFAGQIYIYKVDTTKEKELAGLWQNLTGNTSIPMLIYVPMGNARPIMQRGYRNSQQLEIEINQFLLQK